MFVNLEVVEGFRVLRKAERESPSLLWDLLLLGSLKEFLSR